VIAFAAVDPDGKPGADLGAALRDGDRVTYTSMLAEETIKMLARRFGRTESEIVDLVSRDGWSNGQVMAIT
jgi:predicted pyridoxine 5'-phosphate oxidase superfamily flavin-nucleotide-binding protein